MIDAAFPSKVLALNPPPRCNIIAGYIGGNARNIWTEQEWDDMAKATGAIFRLPIFVRNIPANYSPNADATFCANWAHQHRVPSDSTIALDFETAINYTFVKTFDSVLSSYGYRTILYGSRAFVLLNPKPSGGYWVADYTGTPHLYPDSMATQWSGSGPFSGAYDPNVVSDDTSLWMVGDDDMFTDADRNKLNSLATHQDVITVIEGTPQRPASLNTILTLIQGIPDAIVAKIPPRTTNLTTDQLKQAVKDALKEGTQ